MASKKTTAAKRPKNTGKTPKETKSAEGVWFPMFPMGGGYKVGARRVPGDYQLLLEYATNPIVFSCVNLNANAVTGTNYGVYAPTSENKRLRRDVSPTNKAKRVKALDSDYEEINHPVLDLVEPWHIDVTSRYLDTVGRAYWCIELGYGDQPDKLVILRPENISPVTDANGYVVAYKHTTDQNVQPEDIPAYNADGVLGAGRYIIEFRLPCLTAIYTLSQSPLMSVYGKVTISGALSDYYNSILENRARPEGILSPKDSGATVSEDTAKRVIAKWRNKLGGSGNGGPTFLDAAYEWTPLNYAPADLAPFQIDESVKLDCYNAFAIPEGLMKKDANRASAETAKAMHAEMFTLPRCCLIQNVINRQLMPFFQTDGAYFEFDNPVPDDEELEIKEHAEKRATVEMLAKLTLSDTPTALTLNAAYELVGIPSTPLGDNVYVFLPLKGSPDDAPNANDGGGGSAGAPATPSEPSEAPEPPADDAAKGLDVDAIRAINKDVAKGTLPRATAINLVAEMLGGDQNRAKALVREAPDAKGKRPTFKKLIPILQKHFAEQRAHYLKQIKKGFALDGSGIETKGQLPDRFIPLDAWDAELAKDAKPLIELFATTAADGKVTTYERIGASPDMLAVVPAKVSKAVDKATFAFSQETNQTTTKQLNDALDQLREEMRQGLIEGDTVQELTKRVNDVFDNADSDRAERIARTESNRAVHLGEKIAAQESGIVKGFQWLASGNSCDECQELDGNEIPLDGSFGEFGYGDGDQPPAHPNCTCTMMEILKDADEVNGDNGGE